MDFARVSMRARLRKNGYSYLGAWKAVNPWTASDDKITELLPKAARQANAVLPVGLAWDGHLIKEGVELLKEFFASPLGQAVEQILIKLLLGLIVV